METHPPKLVEAILETLIPPRCREHVWGDLCERSTTNTQFIYEAMSVLPFVLVSQIRRSFNAEVFFAQIASLIVAFGGAPLIAQPAYAHAREAVVPLTILTTTILAALVLCDTYVDPEHQSPRRPVYQVGLALASAYVVQAVLGIVHRAWVLPIWVIVAGSGASIPLLLLLRAMPVERPDQVTISKDYRRAWRMNWIWMLATFVLLLMSPNVVPVSSRRLGYAMIWSALGSSVIQICLFARSTSLAVWQDSDYTRLDQRRDGLLFWPGRAFMGPALAQAWVLFMIGFSLAMSLLKRFAGGEFPADVSAPRVWMGLFLFVSLLAAGVYVRRANFRAADALRHQLRRVG